MTESTRTETPELGAGAALDLVVRTAERLADPDRVAEVAGAARNRDPLFDMPLWQPVSLAYGYPGTALLFGELTRLDGKWTRVAHEHLTRAFTALSSNAPGGLYFGPAAVAAVAQTCAGRGRGYLRLRERLTLWTVAEQRRRLTVCARRPGPGVSADDLDVINGAAGLGRLLLDAAEEPGVAGEEARSALEATLAHLVALSQPVRVRGVEVPGWWVPAERQPSEDDRRNHPDGDFNTGLAHGVAGPLALLASAEERGVRVPGQAEAAARFADWLCWAARADDTGPYWPYRVDWREQVTGERPGYAPTRSAWCYGAPGVAAALHRAGAAFGEPRWRHLALESLRAVLRRPVRDWQLDGPTVCHGLAGLAQVLHRVGADSGDAELRAGAARVTAMTARHAEENSAFLFPLLVRDPPGFHADPELVRRDAVGVLEGAAGVACALLSAVHTELPGPEDRPWDRVLLLS
ncbi:hypothetical protein JOF53_002864 [Crossiella equi]|uniref:Uncharacterized protein n=1 Tax=Crossiella equi TaxID=130796 RepID=A0ABS5ABM8_9PSEU|nr:lanthionine synthetase C family protein [Crossiella equi]MBP2473992.1 hypothetical protein [Crossiella equi]